MKSDWLYPFLLGLCVGAALLLLSVHERLRGGIYVPCEVAEISPDVPIQAREQCRRMRGKA